VKGRRSGPCCFTHQKKKEWKGGGRQSSLPFLLLLSLLSFQIFLGREKGEGKKKKVEGEGEKYRSFYLTVIFFLGKEEKKKNHPGGGKEKKGGSTRPGVCRFWAAGKREKKENPEEGGGGGREDGGTCWRALSVPCGSRSGAQMNQGKKKKRGEPGEGKEGKKGSLQCPRSGYQVALLGRKGGKEKKGGLRGGGKKKGKGREGRAHCRLGRYWPRAPCPDRKGKKGREKKREEGGKRKRKKKRIKRKGRRRSTALSGMSYTSAPCQYRPEGERNLPQDGGGRKKRRKAGDSAGSCPLPGQGKKKRGPSKRGREKVCEAPLQVPP